MTRFCSSRTTSVVVLLLAVVVLAAVVVVLAVAVVQCSADRVFSPSTLRVVSGRWARRVLG